MVRMNHGGLPTAALHGGSPPPYTFDTCDLNFLPKIWSKSVVLGTDPLEDALKRPSTTIPPSITTTHHDGGLPSPLSYTLADDDPPLPSTVPKRSRRNLRERNIFRNDGWTKWEAVQLADELEAKRSKAKADWECWKEAEKQREALDLQINGPFLFEWDDLSEEALRDADKRLRQRRNAYELRKTPFPSSRDSDTGSRNPRRPCPSSLVAKISRRASADDAPTRKIAQNRASRRAGAQPRPGLT